MLVRHPQILVSKQMKISWFWYGYKNMETVQEDTGLGREGVGEIYKPPKGGKINTRTRG